MLWHQMSDDSDIDQETAGGTSDGSGEGNGDGPETRTSRLPRPTPSGRAVRARLFGFLALILGVVGIVLSVIALFLVLRAGFGVTSAVDDLLEPVSATIDRLETRIDQADDTVDRDGVAPEQMPALRARSEGLLDLTGSAVDLFAAVRDHPVYQWLPADLSALESSLDDYAGGASRIEEVVGRTADGAGLSAADSSTVATEIDTLQAGVVDVRQAVVEAARSLRRWIRIGAFFGFLGVLWGLWAQFCLARRGLRAVRGRPV